MIQTSTHNEIIRFLYEETTEDESEQVRNDLIFNEEARNAYYELASVKKMLNKEIKSPPKRVIENVLNYSKSLNLHPVKNAE